MAMKISQDQLKRDIFKPLEDHGLLSQEQFEKAYPADKFERYSISGLNKARLAIFKLCQSNPKKEKAILEKANSDFSSLKRVNVVVVDENNKSVETVLFVRPKLEKAMKAEELNVGGDEDEKEKDDKELDKDMSSDDEEVGGEKDTSEEDVDNEEEEEDDEEIGPECLDVLSFIKKVLDSGDDEIDAEEISDEEGFSDEETNQHIELLVKKGFIEVEEDEDGRGYDVVGITDEGLQYLAENGDEEGIDEEETEEGNPDSEEDENSDVNSDKDADQGDLKVPKNDDQEGDVPPQEGDEEGQPESDMDNQPNPDEEEQPADSGHQPPQAQQQGNPQAGGQPGQQGDPNQLLAFAKQTPTDKLEEYVKDPSNPPQNVQVAQAELDRRKQEGDVGPQGQEEQETPEQKAEKEEFDGWVDEYLEQHDITDLQALVKDLILANPAETKVLKDHYRSDYQSTNRGNQAIKIDKKEFEEWIIQYLEHQPQAHLKDYAKRLASQDPDALTKLKTKYKALKDNKIV